MASAGFHVRSDGSVDHAVLGVKLCPRVPRTSRHLGWKLLSWGVSVFAIASLVFLSYAIRGTDFEAASFHRRLSWNQQQASVIVPERAQVESVLTEVHSDCATCQKPDAEEIPPWPAPEISAVGYAMQKQYQRLDVKARRQCNLQRAKDAHWNNHSNHDLLTRWSKPGIPNSFFDHEISFRYEHVRGKTSKLDDYQCYLLLRGQNYSVLRDNPLVEAQPFSSSNPFGPVRVDGDLKLVAVVFPQFHAFEQNNRFWGSNFTEWTNLKLTFFNPWNFQPIKHPIRGYGGYYNLLDFQQRTRMGALAKYYGIEAFAYHHYWFDCNTFFLERVVMHMVKDGQPDVPFMLIWANEAWTRHWTGETGEFLQTQGYGNSTCWKQHFMWLLPLFKHEKYLKVEGKPVFSIYLVPEVKMLNDMVSLWNAMALDEGFPGIHIVQCLGHKDRGASKHVDALLEYQPNLKRGRLRLKFKDQRLHRVHYRGEYLGWDNYPRHNLDPKFVVGDLDDDPIHVEARLEKRMHLARQDPNKGGNLFFLVAWNEWGEGNILEPNNIFGYGNLNALAVAYNRSRYPQRNDMAVLDDLLEVMEECKLQLDSKFYIEMSQTKLDHLLRRPEGDEAIIDNWEQKGFRKGREFRLVPIQEVDPTGNAPFCKHFSNIILDKVVVRCYLDIFRLREMPERRTKYWL